MPTRRGWLLVLSSGVAAVGGRLLGVRELFMVGAALLALVVAATAYVWLRRFDVRARRTLIPARMPVGETCRVEMSLTNDDRIASPVLTLRDGSRWRVLVSPLAPGETVLAGYEVPGRRRGIVPVGPLRVRLGDPFGVAGRSSRILDTSPLTVHPRPEDVIAPPDAAGSPVVAGPRQLAPSPAAGTDFHALRPYVEGDDLRRVHWPTSARTDQLVVRQDEAPQVRQTVVALDLRRHVHDTATLEAVVSAAASVARVSGEDDGLVRLLTTGDVDTGMSGGDAHFDSILDHLATLGSDSRAVLDGLVSSVAEAGVTSAVVLTTTALSDDDVHAIARLRAHCPQVVTVLFDRQGDDRRPVPRPAVDWIVRVPPGSAFRTAWNTALAGSLVDR